VRAAEAELEETRSELAARQQLAAHLASLESTKAHIDDQLQRMSYETIRDSLERAIAAKEDGVGGGSRDMGAGGEGRGGGRALERKRCQCKIICTCARGGGGGEARAGAAAAAAAAGCAPSASSSAPGAGARGAQSAATRACEAAKRARARARERADTALCAHQIPRYQCSQCGGQRLGSSAEANLDGPDMGVRASAGPIKAPGPPKVVSLLGLKHAKKTPSTSSFRGERKAQEATARSAVPSSFLAARGEEGKAPAEKAAAAAGTRDDGFLTPRSGAERALGHSVNAGMGEGRRQPGGAREGGTDVDGSEVAAGAGSLAVSAAVVEARGDPYLTAVRSIAKVANFS